MRKSPAIGKSTGARKGGASAAICGLLALFCLAAGSGAAADMPAPVMTYGDAMRWYGRAAEAGDAEAQFYLGYMHDRGLHGANDVSEALVWYRRAAAQGDVRAQFRLGLLFDGDPLLPRDPERAQGWYEAAAAQGHAEARFNLARLVETDDAARAVKLYTLAAEAGVGQAAFNLALLRINGPDEVYNPGEAWRWALRAQDLGAPGAKELRDRLAAAFDEEAGAGGRTADPEFRPAVRPAPPHSPPACAAGPPSRRFAPPRASGPSPRSRKAGGRTPRNTASPARYGRP